MVQLFSALAIIAGVTLVSGCGGETSEADKSRSTLKHIQQEGVVRLGYANEAPYAYMDTATGQLAGEAPEIAKTILKQMGIKHIEGVLTEFGSLIPGLKAKRFDIIAAGMYITPPRCREIAFSMPTYGIGEAFIVQAGNPFSLHSYEDVAKHSSAKLGVMTGAMELQYARSTGIPPDRIVLLPDPVSAVSAVQAKRIAAFAGTNLTVRSLLEKTSAGIERADPFHDPIIDGKPAVGYGAFGFRKEDKQLLAEFNKQLEKFMGTPQHLSLIEPLGFTKTDLPGTVTAAQLCQQ